MITGREIAASVLGVGLGTAVQLQQDRLWPEADYALALLLALAMAYGGALARKRWGGQTMPTLLLASVWACASLGCAGWRASERLAHTLAPRWEGVAMQLTGRVEGLPQLSAEGVRFVLALDPVQQPGAGNPVSPPASALPSRVMLNWSVAGGATSGWGEAPAAVRAGEQWRLPVRLRRPHGAVNPGGFDAELWLFDQNIGAVGSVQARRPGEAVRLAGPRWWRPDEALAALRQQWRDRILLTPGDPAAVGLLAALAVGDQSAIDGAGWDVYRRTGIAHLVSISGMHITLFAWAAAALVGRLWRGSARAVEACPAPVVARWGGVALATLYALMAGWGVPAQRTVLMLGLATLSRQLGPPWPGLALCGVAGAVLLLVDPWAALQPGFWLSFVAVGVLIASAAPWSAGQGGDVEPLVAPGVPATSRWRAAWCWGASAAKAAARAQWVVTLGLAPLTLVLFQQLSLVGWLANAVAVPVVTWLITPLALVGVAWPGAWALATWVLQPLLAFLQGLAAHPDAIWSVPQAGWAAAALAVAGGLLAVLPLPWRLRWLGLPLALPLLWPVVPRPAEGEFELLAADVGQGSAVLVRTAHHLLVHDTGPRWAEDGDAGRRTLLPLLQALGEQQVDELVLSHSDLDHVGGAASLLAGIRVVRLRSSLVPGHPLLASAPTPAPVTCAAGQQWQWDGVNFTVLHPAPGAVRAGVKPNTLSCVLRVQDSAGHSALLTGDIEAEQEAALAHQLGPQLRSSVLVVPHHGSRTSSTDAFLAAVQPTQAVIQVGYRSRFGHPHPEVWARYQALGIKVVRTDFCGAWTWRAAAAHCAREAPRRYWQWQIDLNEPEGGVVVATVGSAGEHE